jgi:hypothetical protein
MVSFYDKLMSAFDSKDLDAYLDLLQDDFEVVWHSSGKTNGKEEMKGMMTHWMKMLRASPDKEKARLVYENSDVCVYHSFNRFPDGSVEATMCVNMLRDGKCFKMETGSTLIPEGSPNHFE